MSEQTEPRTLSLEVLVPLLEEQLSLGREVRFTAYGTSMLPLLHNSDVILIPPPERLKKGDLPFYRRRSGQYVLHRVIGINRNGSYVLCGDNQHEHETPIFHDQIIGVVRTFFRDGAAVSVEDPRVKRYVRRLPLRRLWLRYRGMTPKRFWNGLLRRLRRR